jgi:hypothetical protein
MSIFLLFHMMHMSSRRATLIESSKPRPMTMEEVQWMNWQCTELQPWWTTMWLFTVMWGSHSISQGFYLMEVLICWFFNIFNSSGLNWMWSMIIQWLKEPTSIIPKHANLSLISVKMVFNMVQHQTSALMQTHLHSFLMVHTGFLLKSCHLSLSNLSRGPHISVHSSVTCNMMNTSLIFSGSSSDPPHLHAIELTSADIIHS